MAWNEGPRFEEQDLFPHRKVSSKVIFFRNYSNSVRWTIGPGAGGDSSCKNERKTRDRISFYAAWFSRKLISKFFRGA